MKKILFILFFSIVYLQLSAQSTCAISGKVTNRNTGIPIEGAAVSIINVPVGELTDSLGIFSFCHLKDDNYTLLINYIGYETDTVYVKLHNDTLLDIHLKPLVVELSEVEVSAEYIEPVIRHIDYDKPSTSFNKMLSVLPGVAAINIGGGASKPVIRGLSGNRVAVINRGIVRQNQQWGADHGIDVNLPDIYNANVYKGPSSLLLGSGTTTAVEILPYGFENKDFFKGEAQLYGASNNDLYGAGLTARWQKGNWFLQGAYDYKDYADYRLPAEKTDYESQGIAFPDKRLPNSAGKEYSLSGTVGFMKKNVTTYLNVSNNYQKTGLFELEEDHSDHDHDHGDGDGDGDGDDDHDQDVDNSHRNIALPYATANHFAVTNNTEWKTSVFRLSVNTGYQYNHRCEYEHFHEHYEGQAEPGTDDDIAVDFKLRTYSSNARLFLDEKENWTKTIGASVEYQQNKVEGFEYFLPRYNQISGGLSFVNTFRYTNEWLFSAGARYDFGNIDVTGFYDNALAANLEEQGYGEDVVRQYAQRAYDVDRDFGSWSASVGLIYTPRSYKGLAYKANVSKTFRFPSANELAANGVHHAAFRYEIGNPDLKAENGYTLDLGLNYDNKEGLSVEFSPFVNYYSNFIFLQPVEETSVSLYDDKPYQYSQAKAIFTGAEYKVTWLLLRQLEVSSAGSFVLNKNLDDHNPFPFTPPFTMTNEIKRFKNTGKKKGLIYYQLSASHQWYAKQSRVGFDEAKTAGTSLFNASAGFDYRFTPKFAINFNLQVQNIFNTRYLNHLSLYRRLNIPDPGRNIQVFLRIPFNG
jgi:iron complex outermembrane receptor protein